MKREEHHWKSIIHSCLPWCSIIWLKIARTGLYLIFTAWQVDDAQKSIKELESYWQVKRNGLKRTCIGGGVPLFTQKELYLYRLNFKRAIKLLLQEQMEDPKLAKGLVRNEGEERPCGNMRNHYQCPGFGRNKNNYLMGINISGQPLWYFPQPADISTGEFLVTGWSQTEELLTRSINFLLLRSLCNNAAFMYRWILTGLKQVSGGDLCSGLIILFRWVL